MQLLGDRDTYAFAPIAHNLEGALSAFSSVCPLYCIRINISLFMSYIASRVEALSYNKTNSILQMFTSVHFFLHKFAKKFESNFGSCMFIKVINLLSRFIVVFIRVKYDYAKTAGICSVLNLRPAWIFKDNLVIVY